MKKFNMEMIQNAGNEFDRDFLRTAADNIVNGLNACSLDLNLMYHLSEMVDNGWFDEAYNLVCDLNVKMNDADRCSLKYLFYHAKEDYKKFA